MASPRGPKAIAKASAIFRLAGDPIRPDLLLAWPKATLAAALLAPSSARASSRRSATTSPCSGIAGARPAPPPRHREISHSSDRSRPRLSPMTFRAIVLPARGFESALIECRPSRSTRRSRPVSGFVDDAEDLCSYAQLGVRVAAEPVELLGTAEEPRLRNRIMAAEGWVWSHEVGGCKRLSLRPIHAIWYRAIATRYWKTALKTDHTPAGDDAVQRRQGGRRRRSRSSILPDQLSRSTRSARDLRPPAARPRTPSRARWSRST